MPLLRSFAALVLTLATASAGAFEQAFEAPAFVVSVPGLPDFRLAPAAPPGPAKGVAARGQDAALSAEVMAVVERMPKLDRHRGQGLLFGYPPHAIEFFVTAAAAADDANSKPVPRRFVQIPTFASPTGRFVYAVPADAGEHADDVVLREAAAVRLARYRELRHGSRVDDPTVLQDLVTALRTEFAQSPTAAR